MPKVDRCSTAPLPLYPHFLEAQSRRRSRDTQDAAKLFPMRISAIINNIHKDGLISFRWMGDDRKLRKYEDAFNKGYAEKERLGTISIANEVKEGTTYVVFLDLDRFHGYYRCHILNLYTLTVPKQLVLIDYGVIIDVQPETVDLYHHDIKEGPHDRFAFAGYCYLADQNQCQQIGAATIDKLSPGEEVELFLLSSQEPYYAVATSLRNADTKLIQESLVHDFTPEFAEIWNLISMNHFDAEVALRPTMAFSPIWIHGYNPVLVTVPHIESLDKVAVSDLLCSLRSCILTEYLFGHYSKPEVQQALKVTNPMVEMGVGVIVVAYDAKTHRYYRAQITELNLISNSASLVGLDFPNWISIQHSFDKLWLLSKTIEHLPRQFHNISIKRGLQQPFGVKTMLAELARNYCPPNSVALIQYKEKTLDVEFKNHHFPILTLLGLMDERLHYHTSVTRSGVPPFPVPWVNKNSENAGVEEAFRKLSMNKKNEKEAEKVAETESEATEVDETEKQAEKAAETQKETEEEAEPEKEAAALMEAVKVAETQKGADKPARSWKTIHNK